MQQLIFTAVHYKNSKLQLLLQYCCPQSLGEQSGEADKSTLLIGLEWQRTTTALLLNTCDDRIQQ